jgi:hypothetical protein
MAVLNLILKDLLLLKKYIFFGLAYILIMIIAFQNLPGTAMLSAGTVAMTYILVVNSCAYDDKNKADLLLNSLPLSRCDVVLARYLSVFLFASLAIIFYAIIAGVNKFVGLPLKVSPITGEGVVGALLAASFMHSIYLPSYFKFGFIKARLVSFVLFFVVFFEAGTFINRINSIEGSLQVLPRQGNIIFLLVAMVLIIVSYFISLRSYNSRDF